MRRAESGQTIIEFGVIAVVLLTLTMGLVDAGRAFFQYNALADAARDGARWGSVVGGACNLPVSNTTDWCTEQGLQPGGSSAHNFWQLSGNTPLQGHGTVCPKYTTTPADYYTASDPDGPIPKSLTGVFGADATSDNDYAKDTDGDGVNKITTIVGAVGQHFDTSASTTHTVDGSLAGIDLTQLKVCIATSYASGTSPQTGGDYVTVVLYYHFTPASFIAAKAGFDLTAQSTYQIEGTPHP